MRRDEWGASLAVVIAASVTLFGGCGQPPPGGGEAGGSGDERTGEPAARTGGETTAIEVAGNPGLEEAADDYEAYVAEQTALLAARTEAFTEAVLADDVELAKELYAPARVPWERIEPIAAQLGNYDPRYSGAPIGSEDEFDPADLEARGEDGELLISEDSHVRLARQGAEKILRRGYSFTDGMDPERGQLDAGLFFICFQRDPRAQFVPLQRRLGENDLLNDYILHTGSALFACPPGARRGGYVGENLFEGA